MLQRIFTLIGWFDNPPSEDGHQQACEIRNVENQIHCNRQQFVTIAKDLYNLQNTGKNSWQISTQFELQHNVENLTSTKITASVTRLQIATTMLDILRTCARILCHFYTPCLNELWQRVQTFLMKENTRITLRYWLYDCIFEMVPVCHQPSKIDLQLVTIRSHSPAPKTQQDMSRIYSVVCMRCQLSTVTNTTKFLIIMLLKECQVKGSSRDGKQTHQQRKQPILSSYEKWERSCGARPLDQ